MFWNARLRFNTGECRKWTPTDATGNAEIHTMVVKEKKNRQILLKKDGILLLKPWDGNHSDSGVEQWIGRLEFDVSVILASVEETQPDATGQRRDSCNVDFYLLKKQSLRKRGSSFGTLRWQPRWFGSGMFDCGVGVRSDVSGECSDRCSINEFRSNSRV